jgi:hypothetical protein
VLLQPLKPSWIERRQPSLFAKTAMDVGQTGVRGSTPLPVEKSEEVEKVEEVQKEVIKAVLQTSTKPLKNVVKTSKT